jgi:hypothetical protein
MIVLYIQGQFRESVKRNDVSIKYGTRKESCKSGSSAGFCREIEEWHEGCRSSGRRPTSLEPWW